MHPHSGQKVGTAGLDKYTYLVKESGSSIISSMLMEKSLGMLRRAKYHICSFVYNLISIDDTATIPL